MEQSYAKAELRDILEARERRVLRQRELLSQYHLPLVSFTMNIAGPVKNSSDILRGFTVGKQWLEQELACAQIRSIHFEEVSLHTGNEAFYVVECEALRLKQITTEIEERGLLGRLFDLDVIRPGGEKVDRSELGMTGRRCLICSKPAWECARSRTHSVEELQEKTREILRETFDEMDAKEAADLACRALLYEVCTTPKPGLVDRQNNGSHRDMDVFTFVDSACFLRPYFERCVRIGRRTAGDSGGNTFAKLRREGIRAEREMLRETEGVNTHKGAIFSMGIVCAALGRLKREQWKSPDTVLRECASLSAGVVKADFGALKPEQAVTNGQKLFLKYGITGIRGQAEDGFPAVRDYGLPILVHGIEQGHGIQEAGAAALLSMMVHAADTNLIARSDLETQKQIVAQVRSILEETPYPDTDMLMQLDRQFIKQNLSPGGSADLLAICYFLYFLMKR